MAAGCGPRVRVSPVRVPPSISNCRSRPKRPRWSRSRKNNMPKPKFLECVICKKQQPYEPFVAAVCKHCDSQWLEGRYDYEAFKRELLRGLPGRPANMWRYQDVLPIDN